MKPDVINIKAWKEQLLYNETTLASKANLWLWTNIGLAFGIQEWETMLKTGKIAIPSLSLQENELVHNKPTARSYSFLMKR